MEVGEDGDLECAIFTKSKVGNFLATARIKGRWLEGKTCREGGYKNQAQHILDLLKMVS